MQRPFTYRQALLLVAIIPIAAQIVGSAFNIFYNVVHVRPLISDAQQAVMLRSITWVNLLVYPAAIVSWGRAVWRLHGTLDLLDRGEPVAPEVLESAQRLAINLPWWMIGVGSVAWFSCIPMIVVPLIGSETQLDPRVPILLSVSIGVSAMIALTHAFFALELANHKFLYPLLFDRSQPSSIRGAYPLTLRGRGIAWSLSAVFCPIVSILLLFYVPQPEAQRGLAFPIAVGCIAMLFGLVSAWMVGRLYGTPIRELKKAAQAVSHGNLDTQVRLLRADEFGPLIEEFNQMTRGLLEKESLRRMFGLHVGRQAAEQILASVPGLSGVSREITVMFVDIRGFTASSEGCDPTEVVAVLNEFLTAMVDVVEVQHHGMVNKYLGDGFMALFGIGNDRPQHADDAVDAGKSMLLRLVELNDTFAKREMPPLKIGIGIHSGTALVGSIGSNQRLEFTAIGDTVNIASRIESLTKTVGTAMLLTAATQSRLQRSHNLQPHAPQAVKGIRDPIVTYGLESE